MDVNKNHNGLIQRNGLLRLWAPIVLVAASSWLFIQAPTMPAAAEETSTVEKAVTFYVQPQYQLDRDGSWADVPGVGPIAMRGVPGRSFEAPVIRDYVLTGDAIPTVPNSGGDQSHPMKLRYRRQSTGLYTATVNINYVDSQKGYTISSDTKTLHYADHVTLIPKEIVGYRLQDAEVPNQYFAKNQDKSVSFVFKELRDPTYTVKFYYLPIEKPAVQSIAKNESAKAVTVSEKPTVVKQEVSEPKRPVISKTPVVTKAPKKPTTNQARLIDNTSKSMVMVPKMPVNKPQPNLVTPKPVEIKTDQLKPTQPVNQVKVPAQKVAKTSVTAQKETPLERPSQVLPKMPTPSQKSETKETPVVAVKRAMTAVKVPIVQPTTSQPTAELTDSQIPAIESDHRGSLTKATNTNQLVKTSIQPSEATVQKLAVYAIRKISLYRSPNFNRKTVEVSYSKQPRRLRPMFVVIGYGRSTTGKLRYKVRDVNHLSQTAGKVGYITTSLKFVRPVYYVTKWVKVRVINGRGVNAYAQPNLTGKVRNYPQGTILKTKGIVTHNLTTRYMLVNGGYVTANKKLVIADHA